ncbi:MULTISPECIES: DUF1934 domain-containing protein [Paenibacillus]|uniref:DUF1934 domain-containing protein n=1 Tax=Paenibacillus TaxID=44249 RepID=UPI0022B8AF16|nr:DUF1934 domain-containing protein [Paenibacillus caseinilyticus]MCZ8522954.1 DUF1934 domain-containing protein [Paenibacillus caseinilyticus]
MKENQEGLPDRCRVRITLRGSTGSGPVDRTMEGELFPKGGSLYLRYQEPPESEMGRTVTTVKAAPSELRIIRHGDTPFDQVFAAGVTHYGYLDTPQGRMELETFTEHLEVRGGHRAPEPAGLLLTVSWAYRLSVMGEPAGEFRLILTAERMP